MNRSESKRTKLRANEHLFVQASTTGKILSHRTLLLVLGRAGVNGEAFDGAILSEATPNPMFSVEILHGSGHGSTEVTYYATNRA